MIGTDQKMIEYFRHGTSGYNDCFFHSVLTDIDEKYRLIEKEKDRITKLRNVRSKQLKEYLTLDVWKKISIYPHLLDCVEEQIKIQIRNEFEKKIKEDHKDYSRERVDAELTSSEEKINKEFHERYPEQKIDDKLYEIYLDRITHSCQLAGDKKKMLSGIQVDEYMLEVLSNFFERNIYFITTRTETTKRVPYIPSNLGILYKAGRKSIVIAYSQFGNSGHYEGIGIKRGEKEIYDFESDDEFIREIVKYIDFNKSMILSTSLFFNEKL